MRRAIIVFIVAVATLFSVRSATTYAQSFLTNSTLTIEQVANVGVASAVMATHSPDPADSNLLFTVHQGGQIRIIDLDTNTVLPDPFLAVPGGGGESGLVGLAFHPNYATNGRFFINRHDGGQLRIEEYQRGATNTLANPTMVRPIWTHTQHSGSHNAGWIGFNPVEAQSGEYYLWRGLGDGGGPGGGGTPGTGEANNDAQHDPQNRAQTLEEPHGHILRIDIGDDVTDLDGALDAYSDAFNNYGIPSDNPFATKGAGTSPHVDGRETIARGLRHPWRTSFDRETGDFWIGEVLQDFVEEINIIPQGELSGLNFGWRLRDGLIASQTEWDPPVGDSVGGPEPENNANPIFQFFHGSIPTSYPQDTDDGVPDSMRSNSITGGYVYRGPIESLDGFYFAGDFGSGRLWSFTFDGSSQSQWNASNALEFIDWNSSDNTIDFTGGATTTTALAGWGEDQEGNVYLVRHGGEILRIAGFSRPGPLSIPGDTNIDGDVTMEDLEDFLAGWRQTAPVGETSWRLGDFNQNGITDLPDVAFMHEGLLNAGLPSPFGEAQVPEPSTTWLMLAAIALVGRCSGRVIRS